MNRIIRIALLASATVLLVTAAFLAANEHLPGAIATLVLAILAGTFERLVAIQKGGDQ